MMPTTDRSAVGPTETGRIAPRSACITGSGIPRRRRRAATRSGRRSGRLATSRAGMSIGSRLRALTKRRSGRRSTVIRLTYQSPRAVVESADIEVEIGKAAASFCVRRSTTISARVLANAPVQLRAVGPTGAEPVAISISIQALNRNDFHKHRARQLQRRLGCCTMKCPDCFWLNEARYAPLRLLGLAAIGLVLGACRHAPPPPTAPAMPRRLPALAVDDSLRPALLAVGRAALDDALNRTKDTGAVCIVFVEHDGRAFRPEQTDLLALADSAEQRDLPRRFVSITNCPRTYASMILRVDASGNPVDPAPRGYVDPHILSIEVPERWVPKPDERSITVIVRVAQGTGTDEYQCRVRPSSARAAMLSVEGGSRRLIESATCRLDKRYVS